ALVTFGRHSAKEIECQLALMPYLLFALGLRLGRNRLRSTPQPRYPRFDIGQQRLRAAMLQRVGVGDQHGLSLVGGQVVSQLSLRRRRHLHQRREKFVLVDEEWRPHHLRRRRDLTALARWSSYPCHGPRPKRPSTTLPPGGCTIRSISAASASKACRISSI